ncbi:hypothetical protein HC725_01820 [Vibrio sp. S17_S38]|uniref:hypothetical protein n=1 Tax=Vibrio sp. S17_S38 TaxID=2720229 RepID=UPI00168031AB|nr:hypothetical protein [Vibrio sp. S17_S38]MBD1572017.1 hypothetical protein [Vibrio sp. S17_S38]
MNRILYAYLNIDHPMVAWEVAIGRIKSSCHDHNLGVSIWFYSQMQKYIANPNSKLVIDEFKLELVRQASFPKKVSRLKGVYFFESFEMANMALDRWNLTKHKKYITKVFFSADTYTNVDSEWITTFLGSDNDDEWMQQYWSGKTLGVKPLTEIIASGIGMIHDEKIKMQAYQKVIDRDPYTSIFLNMCIAGFREKRMLNIGQIFPSISHESGVLKGGYFVHMEDMNKREQEVGEAFQMARAKGLNLPMFRHSDPDVFFTLPDLKILDFEFSQKEAMTLFDQIHTSIS